MKEKLKQIKEFNWSLFFALCALSLIPAVYQTLKTFIISSSSQADVFDVIGQMEWFDLINETLQAFLIVPLYSVLNKIFKNDGENFSKHIFKTGIASFAVYALFSVGVLIYGGVLIKAMNPDEINLTVVSRYLRLETVAFMVGIIVSFVNVVFVIVGKAKNVYIFLAVNVVMSSVSDFILIPRLGVYGVAVSNITVNLLLAAVSCTLLLKQGYMRPCRFSRDDVKILKEWCKIGVFSGTQQFIDNFVYAVMVCKMVNMVSEQGNYWIANNFIWGWLLIPVSALTEIIRRDCKDGYKKLKQFNYYFVGIAVIALWAVTVPVWSVFYEYVENLTNAREIFLITVKLVPFYIAYIGSVIIDNIFIGLGKTLYNVVNSLIINFVYYGIFYILYLTGTVIFTMDVIILMFGFGMVAHWGVSAIEERFLRKRELLE